MAERGGPVSLKDAMRETMKDMGWNGNISDAECNADPNA